jgi:hypothetical protein
MGQAIFPNETLGDTIYYPAYSDTRPLHRYARLLQHYTLPYIAMVFLKTTWKLLQCATTREPVKESRNVGRIKFNVENLGKKLTTTQSEPFP